MQIAEHIDAVDAQGRALATAAAAAGPAAAVPTCPRWQVRDLLAHIGMVHRWAATHVREGRAAVAGGRQPRPEKAPAGGELDWYVDGHAALVAALRAAPLDIDSWKFLPAPSPLAFWARRQAHETAIHRADAESARDRRPVYETEFAVDGIDELICGFMSRRGGQLLADPARTLLVAPTDAAARWHVTIGPDGRRVVTGAEAPAVADCVIAGAASDVYLMLWNRLPEIAPKVAGDDGVLEIWRRLARITWG